ncbi:MAG: hypothetical protein LQ338_007680 [Usnochroma carphineum]|nr:MAG: hypothetical protein LQ338_007680 [Usnochroma carphineum]
MGELSRNGLTALTWIFTGVGIVLTAGRYAIRLKAVKALKADDYIHGAALIFLIGYVSTYTVMFPLNYSVEFWAAGFGGQPSNTDLMRKKKHSSCQNLGHGANGSSDSTNTRDYKQSSGVRLNTISVQVPKETKTKTNHSSDRSTDATGAATFV